MKAEVSGEQIEKQNAKDWAKVYKAKIIEQGVCQYEDETILIRNEALHKMAQSFKGRPVIIVHDRVTPENMEEKADGYVSNCYYNEFTGDFWADFVVFTDKGKEAIERDKYVSCAYIPTEFGKGGTWHNVPYNREILNGEYTHLAIVEDPRYEDARVYENAKGDKKGQWITVKGTHVFIPEGESKDKVVSKFLESKDKNKKSKGFDEKDKADDSSKKESEPQEPKEGADYTPGDPIPKGWVVMRGKYHPVDEKKVEAMAKAKDKKYAKDSDVEKAKKSKGDTFEGRGYKKLGGDKFSYGGVEVSQISQVGSSFVVYGEKGHIVEGKTASEALDNFEKSVDADKAYMKAAPKDKFEEVDKALRSKLDIRKGSLRRPARNEGLKQFKGKNTLVVSDDISLRDIKTALSGIEGIKSVSRAKGDYRSYVIIDFDGDEKKNSTKKEKFSMFKLFQNKKEEIYNSNAIVELEEGVEIGLETLVEAYQNSKSKAVKLNAKDCVEIDGKKVSVQELLNAYKCSMKKNSEGTEGLKKFVEEEEQEEEHRNEMDDEDEDEDEKENKSDEDEDKEEEEVKMEKKNSKENFDKLAKAKQNSMSSGFQYETSIDKLQRGQSRYGSASKPQSK